MHEITEEVLKAIKEAAPEGRITCARAHELAEQMKVPLIVIGQAADRLNIKIKNCQLGCF